MTALNQLSSYGSSFQIKVLASLLKHKEFLQSIHDVLDEDYFDNPSHKWIIKELLRYYYKYNTVPTLDSLKIEVKKIDNEVLKTTVVEQLKEAYKATYDDQEYVEQEFSNFCKNQQLKKALLSSVDLLNAGSYDEIRVLIDSALKAGQDKNIGHEYLKDVETRYRGEFRSPVATGWPVVDQLLAGGLGAGDFGIIFGNPGGGKSWTLVHIGAIAVSLGYTVVHYTLELSQEYTGQRYDAFFTKTPVNELNYNSEAQRAKVEAALAALPGKLIIKEYPMKKTPVSTLENHIRKCGDLGYKPDLILIDYVDLLRSNRKSAERKDEIDDVYTATKALARELKTPIWTVSQVNRAGARDEIIEGDKAAGSYDKIMIADFIMSLSRKRQDKTGGTGRFHIMKNRYGMDGMTYPAMINTFTGEIDIQDKELSDDVVYPSNGNGNVTGSGTLFNQNERDFLSKKFFELQSGSQ